MHKYDTSFVFNNTARNTLDYVRFIHEHSGVYECNLSVLQLFN